MPPRRPCFWPCAPRVTLNWFHSLKKNKEYDREVIDDPKMMTHGSFLMTSLALVPGNWTMFSCLIHKVEKMSWLTWQILKFLYQI